MLALGLVDGEELILVLLGDRILDIMSAQVDVAVEVDAAEIEG